jgi:hypothetical protein
LSFSVKVNKSKERIGGWMGQWAVGAPGRRRQAGPRARRKWHGIREGKRGTGRGPPPTPTPHGGQPQVHVHLGLGSAGLGPSLPFFLTPRPSRRARGSPGWLPPFFLPSEIPAPSRPAAPTGPPLPRPDRGMRRSRLVFRPAAMHRRAALAAAAVLLLALSVPVSVSAADVQVSISSHGPVLALRPFPRPFRKARLGSAPTVSRFGSLHFFCQAADGAAGNGTGVGLDRRTKVSASGTRSTLRVSTLTV